MKGEDSGCFFVCVLLVTAHTLGLLWFRVDMVIAYRCCVDLQTHLEKSVLSQLPYTYQSIFQQSVINDETDMGMDSHYFN